MPYQSCDKCGVDISSFWKKKYCSACAADIYIAHMFVGKKVKGADKMKPIILINGKNKKPFRELV